MPFVFSSEIFERGSGGCTLFYANSNSPPLTFMLQVTNLLCELNNQCITTQGVDRELDARAEGTAISTPTFDQRRDEGQRQKFAIV